ncbi:MAG: phosphoenolpyruvate--protein phosphotransferase, partial [Chlorobi bacterium]|nr:phosphoenolpyruvate--protein phosphotransferase [Chlorobiota bacterium]
MLRNLQLRRLTGTIEGGRIIFSRRLTPADTVLFSRYNVLGYVTETGGMTSHAAIISRSLNIPAVVAVPGILNEVHDGDLVIIDGYKGLVYINPSDAHLAECRKKIAEIENVTRKLETLRDLRCETRDGQVIELAANAEFVEEIDYIQQQGADGIGLYRTEHLYLLREEFPSEEEQFMVYHEIAGRMHPKPVIFRVFDIGGDKVLDSSAREGNPFMGWRGIRLLLDQP